MRIRISLSAIAASISGLLLLLSGSVIADSAEGERFGESVQKQVLAENSQTEPSRSSDSQSGEPKTTDGFSGDEACDLEDGKHTVVKTHERRIKSKETSSNRSNDDKQKNHR